MADEPTKTLNLRRADKCAECGTVLAVGTRARRHTVSRTTTCMDCPTVNEPRWTPPAHSNPAGGSAQAEHDRRHQKRDAQLDARWGRLAGVAKFLSDDPQSIKAWAQGAEGERRLAAHLAKALGDHAVFLHDRKVGRANIDHLIVASSGVWVVDAKNYTGKVEHRNAAGWLSRADWRVFVGGRDKTKLVTGLGWQVDAVRGALGGIEARIVPAICFTSSEWGLFTKPFLHDGVLVTWASKLTEMIAKPGDLEPEQIQAIAELLKKKLKPAT